MPIRLSRRRVGVHIVALEQLTLFSCRALPPELPSTNGDHFIFTVALINTHEDWHAEYAIRSSKFSSSLSFELHLIDSKDIDLFVFLVETSLLELVEWMDVKLVFLFDVFDVLFNFEEVWCKGGPALWRVDRPDVDASAFNASCCNEWARWVPLYCC